MGGKFILNFQGRSKASREMSHQPQLRHIHGTQMSSTFHTAADVQACTEGSDRAPWDHGNAATDTIHGNDTFQCNTQ